MTILDIYITENCWACEESARIAEDIADIFPDITINLRRFNHCGAPEEVFAVPTYVINGKVAYLGNPSREELIEKLTAVQQTIAPA
jgi:hypothetical protein